VHLDFPLIQTLDDVLPAIKGRNEFIVAEREDYKVVNYVVNKEDTFFSGDPEIDAIRRELRGLIFDNENNLISRPYHKFFNVNEREETQLSVFAEKTSTQNHMFLEKLDGSMVRPLKIGDSTFMATKMGITDTGLRASKFFWSQQKIMSFVDEIYKEFTPIFEWLSLEDRIVLDYGDPQLVLTAIRNNFSGEYISYDMMKILADRFDLNIVGAKVVEDISDMQSVLNDISKETDSEGYVVRFEDGHMVKIKNEWYVTLHRSKELATNDRLIVKCILEESVDDLKPLLMESDLVRVVKMETVVNNALLEIVSSIVEHISTLGEIDRKTYAQTFSDYQFKSMVFAHHFGGKGNLLDIVRQHFLKTTTINKKFDQEGRILLDKLA
jgi:RNA ligase